MQLLAALQPLTTQGVPPKPASPAFWDLRGTVPYVTDDGAQGDRSIISRVVGRGTDAIKHLARALGLLVPSPVSWTKAGSTDV